MKVFNLTTATLTAAVLAQSVTAAVVADFQFNTVSDTEDWVEQGGKLDSLTADGDSLNGTSIDGDPRIANYNLGISTTAGWDTVVFRVRELDPDQEVVNTFDSSGLVAVFNGGGLSFTNTASRVIVGGGSFSATGPDVDGFFTVTADISAVGTATIDQMRLDPIANGAGGSTFEVDYIQINDVPEPSSLALLGLGGLLIARRRRG